MTQSDKLEALIQRAVDGGFDRSAAASWIRSLITDDPEATRRFAPMLVFNHDFARALFGERTINALTGNKLVAKKLPEGVIETVYVDLAWEYHLKRAVISDNPIDYTYRVVFNDITDGIPEGHDIV